MAMAILYPLCHIISRVAYSNCTMFNSDAQSTAISGPIREKNVQIFSLHAAKYLRNVSENNLGKAHENRLLRPSWRRHGLRDRRGKEGKRAGGCQKC